MTDTWSWRHAILKSALPATTKHVLMVISVHMNDVGEGCYPSTKRIAELGSLSERSVCTHIDDAEKAGWLVVKRHGFNGQGWARHEYKPLWPEGAEANSAREGTERPSEGTEPDDEKALKDVQSIVSSNEHPKKISKSKKAKVSKRANLPLRSLDQFLQDSGGQPPREFSDYAASLGWTPEFAGNVWTRFCRYWRSPDAKGGGRKRDWLSTWQNWCDAEDGRRGRTPGNNLDRGLAGAMRASLAGRNGASQTGSTVHPGQASAGNANADGGREVAAIPAGEIPF